MLKSPETLSSDIAEYSVTVWLTMNTAKAQKGFILILLSVLWVYDWPWSNAASVFTAIKTIVFSLIVSLEFLRFGKERWFISGSVYILIKLYIIIKPVSCSQQSLQFQDFNMCMTRFSSLAKFVFCDIVPAIQCIWELSLVLGWPCRVNGDRMGH